MGISKDLGLVGNDFSNAASAFFIAYLIAEVPTGKFLYPRYQLVLTEGRICSPEGRCCEMARSKRLPLGNRNSLSCCSFQLPFSSRSSHLPRRLRSGDSAVPNVD